MLEKRVHIVFNSRENERITQPIISYSPNTLYYFIAYIEETGQNDENIDYFEENYSLLKQNLPQLDIIRKKVDYTDYIQIIQKISKIIKVEREKDPNTRIFINVGSGSKMTAIASIEASKLWDCDVYYVYSTKYDPSGKGPEHKGEMIIKTPITFPIKKPDDQIIKILQFIQNLIENRYKGKQYDKSKRKFIYKKNLVEQLFEQGLISLIHKNKEERKLQASKYMKSQKYLNPMEQELKFIEISKDKRNKKIYITDLGYEILEIFKYQI
ncbi:MAG: hypothetical protein EU541_00050 [Promethearchaeota archaeon]|nr:MAG: hypothetical protein EU541_00050 [Candidatus Lokiarchaeota archaeon]